jgi:nicotinate-nucleotide pyrophosphorylase (carboxylating)
VEASSDIIDLALAEDIGTGDVTTIRFIPAGDRMQARIFAKERLVVAGTVTAQAVYQRLAPELTVTIVLGDGERAEPGQTILKLSGSTRAILTGERVALNFLQRLSGIATLTRTYVEAVAGSTARILDTRKTTPGLRQLEKEAVKAGGGQNHRAGLYDGVIVKDNHLLAKPDLAQGLRQLRAERPGLLLELEADTLDQVRRFATWPEVDVILLDNMGLKEMRAAVSLRRSGLKFEASGGVDLSQIRAIAETGVDYISVGKLTHSAPAVDISLELLA